MTGDNVEMTVELIHNVAMEQGFRFAIREGGRTDGSGAVATIIEKLLLIQFFQGLPRLSETLFCAGSSLRSHGQLAVVLAK